MIECAFGELVMRFSILWRSLKFRSLEKNNAIIRALFLLHNFLVDSREDDFDYDFFVNLSHADISKHCTKEESHDGDFIFPLVSDNNEPALRGRKSLETIYKIKNGERLRDSLCITLFSEGMHRRIHPTKMKYNHLGHVYCI